MRDNDSYVDFAKFLENLLKNRSADTGVPAADVYYGDQQNIPRTPTACVEPSGKTRQLLGAPRRTEVALVCYIIVYQYEMRSQQTNREQADRLIETIEGIIHEDAYMGDSVVHSMVSSIESGYLQRQNSVYRASRLTVEGQVVKQLPSQF